MHAEVPPVVVFWVFVGLLVWFVALSIAIATRSHAAAMVIVCLAIVPCALAFLALIVGFGIEAYGPE